jgi:hypothetical protein
LVVGIYRGTRERGGRSIGQMGRKGQGIYHHRSSDGKAMNIHTHPPTRPQHTPVHPPPLPPPPHTLLHTHTHTHTTTHVPKSVCRKKIWGVWRKSFISCASAWRIGCCFGFVFFFGGGGMGMIVHRWLNLCFWAGWLVLGGWWLVIVGLWLWLWLWLVSAQGVMS